MMNYESRIEGEITCLDFADLEAAAAAGTPEKFDNQKWMVTGPFVARTEGAFETEYLYEREKILQIDYLALDGGETGVVPYLGLRGHNEYEGCKDPVWARGLRKWNMLRFDPDDGDSACDEALYMTEQRNCVFYAATYVRCAGRKRAVICYENSGCRLFVNGRLVSDVPYGRVKGVPTMGNTVPVVFEDGLNLILFKLRPGYICDTVDLSMTNCSIYPIAAESGPLGLTYPAQTGAYVQEGEQIKQIFPCFAASFGHAAGGEVEIDGWQKISLPEMQAGATRLIRAEIDTANAQLTVPVAVTAAGCERGEGSFVVHASAAPAFRGTEIAMTSFHFDTTYHQEQRVYAMGAIYILREILKEMRRDDRFKAIISEVDYLHPYYSLYPEDRAFLKEKFIDGHAESDCFYNQPNEMTSAPEGMVRNLVYGQLYHRDVLGRICDVYSPGDVFGHFNQMSQLSAKGGCGGVYWGKHIFGFRPAFRHVSPDGTSLIHRRGGVGRWTAEPWGLSLCEGSGSAMMNVPGYPVDGDLSWMDQTVPKARYGVPSELRKALDADETRIVESGKTSPFGLTSRDMSLYHAGVSLTRMDFKQANRMAENLLITAEKLSVIAAMNGAEYPERALDKAWRQVLCGQHHDSITGTNNEVSFVDLMVEYREAVELAADICDRAASYIASHICTENGRRAVVLFNPHAWTRTEHIRLTVQTALPFARIRVTDLNGKPVPAQPLKESVADGVYTTELLLRASVPACGYTVCYLDEKPALTLPGDLNLPTGMPEASADTVIENTYYRIQVDPAQGGGIVSLYDKEAKRELINPNGDGPANRLVALKETHDRMETQHEFYTTGHKLLSDGEQAQVECIRCAEFEQLKIRYELGNVVHVSQEITLRRGDRRIDFQTRLDDYRDEDDLMTLTFPVQVKGAKPIFDDRFAPQVRTASKNALSFRTHQFAMASHCAVYAANQWLDYGPTVTMHLHDGFRSGSFQFGMTQIIRREDPRLEALSDALLMALTKKAIPVTPFPDHKQSCEGSQIIHFNEDLSSDTRIVLCVDGVENEYETAIAERFATPYARLNAAAKTGAAALYIRDTENTWNKPIDVLLVKAPTVDALQIWVDDFAKALANGHAYETGAVLGSALDEADDYGVALINTGNIACSIEKGDMLNLMLFHTAEFYGNIGNANCGRKLVPEQKSHIFTYSLLPHTGSYREAQLYRRALEKNDPLFAVTDFTRAADAALPQEKSFLSADDHVVVTAVKAGGYPYASMKGNAGTLADRGITFRCFEQNGVATDAKIRLGFRAEKAERANLLEEDRSPLALDESVITLPVTPHAIETVVIQPVADEIHVGTAQIGATHEITEPTYVRSWEHDLGTMPMGYLSLCAVISRHPRQLDDCRFEVDVSVANNHTDISADGTAQLLLPEGWKADIHEIRYDLQPGECMVQKVTVEKLSADAKGILRLEYGHLGQTFEDIFEVGYFNPELNFEINGDEIDVTVINDTDECLRGELALATPVETWGDFGGKNPFGAANITPYQQPVSVPAHSRQTFRYTCTGDTSLSFWAVAKLMVNGRIYFKGGLHRPVQPHVLWAHTFVDEIYRDGGSIRKMNELE